LVGGDFFNRTWQYAKYNSLTYLRRILERNPSSGVYLNGSTIPITGMALNGLGLLSMLYTEPEYRNKGYAKITTQNLIKEVRKRKLIACSFVDSDNSISRAFHDSIGMKAICQVYFIINDM